MVTTDVRYIMKHNLLMFLDSLRSLRYNGITTGG